MGETDFSQLPDNLTETLLQLTHSSDPGSHLILGYSVTGLVLTSVFGLVGLIYFRAGKKEPDFVKLLSGIGLLVYPMFIQSTWGILGIGIGLVLLPYIIKRYG